MKCRERIRCVPCRSLSVGLNRVLVTSVVCCVLTEPLSSRSPAWKPVPCRKWAAALTEPIIPVQAIRTYPLGSTFKGEQSGAKEQEYPIHHFGTNLTAVWPLAWEMRAKKGEEATTGKSGGAAKRAES